MYTITFARNCKRVSKLKGGDIMVYFDTNINKFIYAFQAENCQQVLKNKDYVAHVLASILKSLYMKRDLF